MKCELRRLKGERQPRHGMRRRCAAPFTHHSSPFTLRHAVTLIELLITITIVAVLSATFLGVSSLAMESARQARTKTTISKIHSLLMEKWNSYATRRVDIIASASQRANGRLMADLRLLGVRELMRLEMPDRWSDIVLDGIPDTNPKSVIPGTPDILSSLPAITRTYRRRFGNLKNTINGTPLDGDTVRQFQGAECLYMIIMLTTGDGEARSHFSEQDIGDLDGDGAPEFLDGWGRPISFIRWPAGFANVGRSSLMSSDADKDHDPFDPFRRDQPQPTPSIPPGAYPPKASHYIVQMRSRHNLAPDPISAYRLVPLVYSGGPDGISALVTSTEALVFDPYLDYTANNNGLPSLGAPLVNEDGDDNSLDNIHNHLQDNR